MNKEIVNEIKFNIDDSNISANAELNKMIVVKVDKGLLGQEKRITNELIDIGYSDLFVFLSSKLKEAVKYIKRVNFNKPFKQNFMGYFWGIELDADMLSSTTRLYTCLLDMVQMLPFFETLFKKIDEVSNNFSNMVENNDFHDITALNKTALHAQIKGLMQMLVSLLSLYNSYGYVLKNPQIKKFFIEWLEYKKKLLCDINEKYRIEAEEQNIILLSRINKL